MTNFSMKVIHQIKYITQFSLNNQSFVYINVLARTGNFISCTLLRTSSSTVKLSYTSYEYPKVSLDPPVFIFHGIVGNKTQWEKVGKKILDLTERNVVAVDLRNHGDSPHTNSHKYTELAKDVLLLLELLGAQKASLIGHSMGGRTAMCVALMAPHKVSGLQVVDVSPISTPFHFREYIPKLLKAMKAVNFENIDTVSAAKKLATHQLKHMFTNDLILADLLTNIRVRKDGSIGWVCNIDVLLKDIKYLLSFPKVKRGITYDGPTLFVGGQLSEFIPPDELNLIRSLFPRTVVTYITKTRHQLHADNFNIFLNLTASFIRTHKYNDSKPIKRR